MTDRSKFQKFTMVQMSRTQLHDAPYNPRQIDDDARRKLRKSLKEDGLVMPIVVNKRTGHVVAGHQRIALLDGLERSQDYTLDVAVIDVPERQEKALNVKLNNQSVQGEWDVDKLKVLWETDGFDFEEDFGFTAEDKDFYFGDPEEDLREELPDSDGVRDAKQDLAAIREARAEMRDRVSGTLNADFYFTVVCESSEQKAEVIALLGLDEPEDEALAFVPVTAILKALGMTAPAKAEEDDDGGE